MLEPYSAQGLLEEFDARNLNQEMPALQFIRRMLVVMTDQDTEIKRLAGIIDKVSNEE